MQQYEFNDCGQDAEQHEPTVEHRAFKSDSAARSHAGRKSVKIKGPVDFARAGGATWEDRYMTTASPSEHHAAGYRFERLT